MASWREAGIPLRVVLEALESLFAARCRAPSEGAPRPILSLGYCRHAVKEAFHIIVEQKMGAGRPTYEQPINWKRVLVAKETNGKVAGVKEYVPR